MSSTPARSVSNQKATEIKNNVTADYRYCERIKVKILYTSKRAIKQIKKHTQTHNIHFVISKRLVGNVHTKWNMIKMVSIPHCHI